MLWVQETKIFQGGLSSTQEGFINVKEESYYGHMDNKDISSDKEAQEVANLYSWLMRIR